MLRTKASETAISALLPRVSFHTDNLLLRSRLLAVVIVLISIPALSIARDEPERVRKSELHKHVYELDGRVRLPAELFYEAKALALITN